MISLKNVSYKYSHSSRYALNHISIDFKKSEFVSIIGHNGSGKSTLVKIIMGILIPTEGDVYIDGEKVTEDNFQDIREKFAIVFQNPDNQFVGATVEDDVAFGLENRGVPHETMKDKVESALREVGMWEFRTHEPHRLSGGQKQRVAIAGALVTDPDVLIMDESTSMLDPTGRRDILSLLKNIHKTRETTIIYITHDLTEIEDSDYAYVMRDGKIRSEGQVYEIYQDTDVLKESNLVLPFNIVLSEALMNGEYMSYEELVERL